MTELFLDGKPVVFKDNLNIKLTSENFYFTKSASYTFDIELPIDVEPNRLIFGWINRPDISKEIIRFDARLVVDNINVLSGTAHITSIDEQTVKVQLLGENASFNYGNKMDDTFIDQLDLGDWYMTTWPDGSYYDGRLGAWRYYPSDTHFKGTSDIVFSRAKYTDEGDWSDDTLIQHLFSGEYPWVAFPTINSTAEFLCNGYCYRFTDANLNAVKFYLRAYVGERTGRRPSDNPIVVSGAIQPYVWIMAEKIAKATGYTLERTNNALFTNSFFKKIFIVNANNYIECNKCLPHWSVNEWWTQIENTFGLTLSIDYSSRKLFLKERKDYYNNNAQVIVIDNVVDEYKSEIDDDTQVDISVNNVGFAEFENAPSDLLSNFILDNAIINSDYNTLDDLLAWANSQGASAMASYKDTIFDCADGHQYVYTEADGLIEVNMFRPRRMDSAKEDIDIELKFVPCRFIEAECEIYPPIISGGGASGNVQDKPIGVFPVNMLQVPGTADMEWYKKTDYSDFDIEAIISGEIEETSASNDSADVIPIAIANFNFDTVTATVELSTGGTYTDDFGFPRAYIRSRQVAHLNGTVINQDAPDSLSIIPIADQNNLAFNTINNSVKANTRVRYCFSFIADRIPDVTSIFLLHNKRFMCEKIEANIDSLGLNKLLTGYFYELIL